MPVLKGGHHVERFKSNYFKIALFILPAFSIYVFFMIYPVAQAFYYSLNSWSGFSGESLKFVGLENFVDIFSESVFWNSYKNILYFMILNILIQIPVGLVLAYLLSMGFKGSRFFKAAFFIPIILSATSISLMWRFILYPETGLLDVVLTKLGWEELIHSWLVDPKTAIFTLILIGCWQNVGVVMVIFLSSIVSIPDSIFESANLDGANEITKLFSITIPMTWEAMKINIILLIIGTIKTFDIIYIMTNGGPNNLTDVPATLMIKEAFHESNYGSASAVAVSIFIFAFVVTIVTNRFMHRETIEL